jgi:hypothetical protein
MQAMGHCLRFPQRRTSAMVATVPTKRKDTAAADGLGVVNVDEHAQFFDSALGTARRRPERGVRLRGGFCGAWIFGLRSAYRF